MDKLINLDGIVIEVVSRRIRNIRLSVHPPDGRVRLSVPHRMNPEDARAFAASKLPWIKKHRKRLLEQANRSPREFADGENLFLFGRKYVLNVIENDRAGEVGLNGSTIEIHVRKNISLAGRKKILTEWYRNELKRVVPGLIMEWESRIGVKSSGFGIKSMKTRWGSCNRRTGMIWLNLELARRPERCLEYVIVHELVHLLERGHGEKFKRYMDKFIPEWRRLRKELNRPVDTDG